MTHAEHGVALPATNLNGRFNRINASGIRARANYLASAEAPIRVTRTFNFLAVLLFQKYEASHLICEDMLKNSFVANWQRRLDLFRNSLQIKALSDQFASHEIKLKSFAARVVTVLVKHSACRGR